MGFFDKFGGAIISAGSSLLGGVLGDKSDEDAAAANRAYAEQQQRLNYEQQKEFAQHGIRWKVEDAKAAGIHPLYALGAPTASFSSSFVDGGFQGSRMGDAIAEAGNGISRAMQAGQTADERAYNDLNLRYLAAQLKGAELNNEMIASDIALKRSQLGAPVPSLLDPQTGEGPATMAPGTGGVAPFWKMGYTRDGRPFRVYNDDLGDNEMMMALSSPITAMDIGASYGKSAHDAYIRGGTKILRKIGRGVKGWLNRQQSYANQYNRR